MSKPSLLWFRSDLRLADNPALQAALRLGEAIIPLFVWEPGEEGDWALGGAARWWLHQSLAALDRSLRQLGSRLIIARGPALPTLLRLARGTGAGALFWNRRYEPAAIQRDGLVKAALRSEGLQVERFRGALLHEPWAIQNQAGKPYQVFTPFWRACLAHLAHGTRLPLPRPEALPAPAIWPDTLPLSALRLEPKLDWAAGLRAAWQPGEAGAAALVERFDPTRYPVERDRPDLAATSRLSPHLRFGEVSPGQLWHQLQRQAAARPESAAGTAGFLRQLIWREFAYHLLYHFPESPTRPLRPEFERFPWRDEPAELAAWQQGRTGYPLVDAGMRELWQTGWMHNRARMVAASYLVKHLLLPWQPGAVWFWDTLVDADLANNTMGWQWVAGSGADAAPYFRIFNPVAQGERFDPTGAYIRRWVPELAGLPDALIQTPWRASATLLAEAAITLGRSYPFPLVAHELGRQRALGALATMQKATPAPKVHAIQE